MGSRFGFRRRTIAAAIHLAASGLVGGAIALWIFFVWYPEPFRSISGGLKLFAILMSVDLVLGPGATFVMASPGKSRRELRMDIGFVVMLQLAALTYGIWNVYQARPVHVAFEIDRFRVIHAVEVPEELMTKAPEDLRSLPLLGPRLVGVRPFVSERERMDVTMAALGGVAIGARPDLWTPYQSVIPAVLAEARPLSDLFERQPQARASWTALAERTGLTESEVVFLPLVSRDHFWTVLLNRESGQPLGYLPVDPYEQGTTTP